MKDKINLRNDKEERHGEWILLWSNSPNKWRNSNNNIKWHSFFINGFRFGHSKVYDHNGNLDQNRYYAK